MYITRIPSQIKKQNSYVVHEDSNNECLIIDPGFQLKNIIKYIERKSLKLVGILWTHTNPSFFYSSKVLSEKYRVKIYAYQEDVNYASSPLNLKWQEKSWLSLLVFMNSFRKSPFFLEKEEFVVLTNQEHSIGRNGIKFDSFQTPGLTPGSCIFKIEETIFVGDTLFTEERFFDSLVKKNVYRGKNLESWLSTIKLLNKTQKDFQILPCHGKKGRLKPSLLLTLEKLSS